MSAPLDAPGVALDAGRLIALRSLALGLPIAARPVAGLPGGHSVRRRGHGQDMADVREYAPGDDLRHIDPGSTARTGVPHVRTYEQERDRVTVLVADFRPAMLWGTRRAFRSVAASEALALEGWRAVEAGGRVGALVIGPHGMEGAAPRARRRGMLDVIGAMVRGHARALAAADVADPPLDACLAPLDRLAPTGAGIVLATALDCPGAALATELARLGVRRHVRIVLVEGGTALPPGDYPVAAPMGQRFRARVSASTVPTTGPRSVFDRLRALLSGPVAPSERHVRETGEPEKLAIPEGVPVLRVDAAAEPERTARLMAAGR